MNEQRFQAKGENSTHKKKTSYIHHKRRKMNTRHSQQGNKPFFSVVTPSFNQGGYIRDCINSVLGQGDNTTEHIIVDGGSTDGTLNILNEYPHLTWTSESDDGISDALNKGIRQARGDWIVWLSADDYLLEDAFKHMFACLQNQPDSKIIFSNYYHVDAEKKFLDALYLVPIMHKNKKLFYSAPASGTFFHRDLFFKQNLWYDTKLHIIMDVDFWARLDAHDNVISKAAGFGSAFRIHGENASLKRHFMEKKDAQARWQKHLAERRHMLAKVFFPEYNLGRWREPLWHIGRRYQKSLFQVERLLRGCYYKQWRAQKDLVGQVIASANR